MTGRELLRHLNSDVHESLEEAALMMDSVSIGKFRRRPLRSLYACQGRPLAVTSKGETLFHCVPADLYAKWIEAVGEAAMINRATSRRNDFGRTGIAVREDAEHLLRNPAIHVQSKPILFHPHAYEEWGLLPVDAQRQVLALLDATSEEEKPSEPFACLSPPSHSVRIICEVRSDAFVLWAICDRFHRLGMSLL